MNFKLNNSFGLVGAAEDASTLIQNEGLQEATNIFQFSFLNGQTDLESGVPLVNTFIFINSSNEEVVDIILNNINY